MPPGKKVPRSGQKAFTLGPSKAAFEVWCDANNYDPNGAVLAAWVALAMLPHEERTKWFTLVKSRISQGIDLDEVKRTLGQQSQQPRPADSPTESRPASRRAG